MAKSVITNIESKTKANRHFTLKGIMFVGIYLIICYMLKNNVNGILFIPYIIFNALYSIFFILPSTYNKNRNNLESIFILLKQDKNVYRPLYRTEREGREEGV